MQIGMIGLGRMGMNMARRLLQGGHQVVAFNRSPAKSEELAQEGATAAFSVKELVGKLAAPRVVWLMLPAGETVDQHLEELAELLSPGDLVVEGATPFSGMICGGRPGWPTRALNISMPGSVAESGGLRWATAP